MLGAGITGLSLLITPFLLQLTERYLLNDDDTKVCLSPSALENGDNASAHRVTCSSLTLAERQVGALQLFQVRTNGGRHISALDLSIGDGDELLVAHGSPPPDDVRHGGRDTRRDRDRAAKGRSRDGSPRVSQGSFL